MTSNISTQVLDYYGNISHECNLRLMQLFKMKQTIVALQNRYGELTGQSEQISQNAREVDLFVENWKQTSINITLSQEYNLGLLCDLSHSNNTAEYQASVNLLLRGAEAHLLYLRELVPLSVSQINMLITKSPFQLVVRNHVPIVL